MITNFAAALVDPNTVSAVGEFQGQPFSVLIPIDEATAIMNTLGTIMAPQRAQKTLPIGTAVQLGKGSSKTGPVMVVTGLDGGNVTCRYYRDAQGTFETITLPADAVSKSGA